MLDFGEGLGFPAEVFRGDGKSMIKDRMFIRKCLDEIQSDEALACAIDTVCRPIFCCTLYDIQQ
jgi:hypothetical protein